MAGELRATNTTGTTVYAVIFSLNQTWTGGNTFGSITQTNMNANTVSMVEQNSTGIFTGNFPSTITNVGRYGAIFYQQSGGSPAIATDVKLGSPPPLDWLGTVLASGVSLDFTQIIPTTNTAQTVGDALNAARAQGFGKWIISGSSLALYAGDGTTIVRTFILDNASAPTQRT